MQTFNRYVIIADYNINPQAFANNCINKAKPQMHCNGKCQMMKKILEQEKKEKKALEKKGVETFDSFCSKSFFATTSSLKKLPQKKQYAFLNSPKAIKRTFKIFRPPSLVVTPC